MRRFWGSGSRMGTFVYCVELSKRIDLHHMLQVVFPFCGLQLAYPFPTLCSGSGTSVFVEEQRIRQTGLMCSKMLNPIEGWIIPCHYERNDSRWTDDICYQVMGVDCERRYWVLSG